MKTSAHALHVLGVVCGLAAGAWLGAAEAPTKLVAAGYSPFLISLGMVAGVFVARWTVPVALKGTGYILLDLRQNRHLVVWAILAGMLWAVANTLTVFAIRDVGLSIAFPLWNTNSLVGLLWAGCCSTNCADRPRSNGAAWWEAQRPSWWARACWPTPHRRVGPRVPDVRRPWGFWRRWARAAMGHHVHSLSQGIYQRDESALVRDSVHLRRVGHGLRAGADFRWRLARRSG